MKFIFKAPHTGDNVARMLQNRAMAVENMINKVRLGILIMFALTDSFIIYQFGGFSRDMTLGTIAIFTVILVIFGILNKLTNGEKYRKNIKYFSISFDLIIVFFSIQFYSDLIISIVPITENELVIFGTIVFIIFNMLSALRSNRNAITYSGVLTLILNGAIYYIFDRPFFYSVYTSAFILISIYFNFWISERIVLQVISITDLNETLAELKIANQTIQQSNEEISLQRDDLEKQRNQILQQSKQITDSIQYAKRLQKAILPRETEMEELLSDFFVFFQPRNIVSGDFYWMDRRRNQIILVVADCTGHGVPGALMSMLGISLLNSIVHQYSDCNASEMLELLRQDLKSALHQSGNFGDTKDGIDMALCIIDTKQNVLEYAGAHNPIYFIREGELNEIKGTKSPIGIHPREKKFENHRIPLKKSDVLYLFSDGFMDQMGGESGKRYMSRPFKKLLTDIHSKPMKAQKEILTDTFQNWKGSHEQVDDVLVLGVKFQ